MESTFVGPKMTEEHLMKGHESFVVAGEISGSVVPFCSEVEGELSSKGPELNCVLVV